MANEEGKSDVKWVRGRFFPLSRAFFRALYGDLNKQFVCAAAAGKTSAAHDWVIRGADIGQSGQAALNAALKGHHYNTVAWLLHYGVNAKNLPPEAGPREKFSLSAEGPFIH